MRLLLLLSLSLLAGASSAADVQEIVGSASCTWGPAYWCGGGFRQSRECGATRHCIDNVWSKMRVPQDNDDVCTVCKNMVTEARDTLRSNETQEELKEVFEGSCALIPIKVIRHECDNLVDEFVPELVETLSSEMNPDLVCSTAGLCNSARIDNLLKSYYASNPRKTECDFCKAETVKIKRKIREIAKDDVEDKLLEACGLLGSYSDACRATLIDNFDAVYRMLQRINEQEVCDAVGLCSESLNKVPAVYRSSQPQDVQCEFCEKVIQHWVDTWTANTTQDEFKEVLEALCQKLDRTSRVKHCLHIVDDYYLPWFNFLLHEINPKQICAMVGLCGGSGFMKVNEQIPITMLLPAVGNELHSEPHSYPDYPEEVEGAVGNEISAAPSNRLIGGYFIPQTAIAAEKPGCVICEYAVTELVDYLDNNKTEAAIEKALVRLCLKLPKSVKGQCHDLVVKYGDALIKLLAEDMDPAEICGRLGLCPNPDLVDAHPAALLDHQASLPEEIQVAKWEDDTCALCEMVMEEVFDALNDTSDRRMVKNLLESACYRLPDSLENACVKMVNEFADPIIDAIVNSVDRDMVCTKLKMCASRLPAPPPPRDSKAECVMCETVMAKLDDMIADRQNQAEVKEALSKVCGYIPSMFSSQCKDYVDQYGDMIMDMLAQELSPEMICSQLGFCVKAKARLPSGSDQQCTLCEFAMSTLERILGDKKNEEEVRDALDQLCGYMPKSVSEQCVEYVDAYAEQIIDMITQDLKPHQVCEAIGLCETALSVFPVTPVEHEVEDVGPLCTLCEYTISDLDRYITDPHNEEEVKNALDRVCYELSNPVKDECVRLVNSYLEDLVQMIVSEYTPEEICVAIRMCGPKEEITNNELPPILNEVRPVSPPSSSTSSASAPPFCVICEFAMNIVEKKVLNNRTFDMVERAVEMVCAYMPESVADRCEDFVADYGDEIIRLIVEMELGPREVCAALTLCATPPPAVEEAGMFDARAVGGRKCSWGPSYWCKTPFHARQCGTTRHCEERVWGEERRRRK